MKVVNYSLENTVKSTLKNREIQSPVFSPRRQKSKILSKKTV